MKKLKIKPCPCCGNTRLSAAVTSTDTTGVRCRLSQGGCGLRMEHDLYMSGPAKVTYSDYMEAMLDLVVSAWNRRVENSSSTGKSGKSLSPAALRREANGGRCTH